MFLRGLRDVSPNEDLIEISQRHLMPAGSDFFQYSSKVDHVFFILTTYRRSQRQSPEMYCKKRCSQKYRNIHRKTTMSETLFYYSCRPQACNRSFSVDFVKFLRASFLKEHLWWLRLRSVEKLVKHPLQSLFAKMVKVACVVKIKLYLYGLISL